jgi:methionyl-tRNA synthetase
MISQKNLDFLHEKKLEYILGYRMRTIPKKDRWFVLSQSDLKRVREDLSFKEVIYNGLYGIDIVSQMLLPFLPDTATKALASLGLKPGVFDQAPKNYTLSMSRRRRSIRPSSNIMYRDERSILNYHCDRPIA